MLAKGQIELIETIRTLIPREEFDYQMLLDALKGYARPRDKITQWLKRGVIIRVKKGLYVFGEGLRRRPYSRELLANLVYGPSYLSQEWALQYYGLIPERVEALTSVTTGRSRKYRTPAGLFIYRQIPLQAFRAGMTRAEIDGEPAFLVATREKALADKIRLDIGTGIGSVGQMRTYLIENLRIEEEALAGLDSRAIADFARRYGSRRIQFLSDLVRHMQKEKANE
jgi:predicted transcriptional regulator of viral defense system